MEGQGPVKEFLFYQFAASFNNESPKEALLAGLSDMHQNKSLRDILDIVWDFEAEESVLFQKLFVDRKNQMGIMFDCIGVSFRLHGFSEDTIIACLPDELDTLRVFLATNGTLSSQEF